MGRTDVIRAIRQFDVRTIVVIANVVAEGNVRNDSARGRGWNELVVFGEHAAFCNRLWTIVFREVSSVVATINGIGVLAIRMRCLVFRKVSEAYVVLHTADRNQVVLR